MLKDAQLEMSKEQVVTASAASTDYINIGAAGDALGKEPYLVIQVKEAADSSGDAATVTFSLQTDSDPDFNVALSTLYSSAAIPQASLTLDSEPVKIRLPQGLKQYVRVYYTVGTESLTKGKFNAFIVPDYPVR